METLTDAGELPVGQIGYTHDTAGAAEDQNNPYNTLDSMRERP